MLIGWDGRVKQRLVVHYKIKAPSCFTVRGGWVGCLEVHGFSTRGGIGIVRRAGDRNVIDHIGLGFIELYTQSCITSRDLRNGLGQIKLGNTRTRSLFTGLLIIGVR
ncbi:hypothetical protein D3C87_1602020 [compost metagenome]